MVALDIISELLDRRVMQYMAAMVLDTQYVRPATTRVIVV